MLITDEALRELTALSGVVLAQDDLAATLDEICRISVRAVPEAAGASLTALSESGPGAVASSDEWAKSLDEMQYVEHEGPCLDAARTGLVFRVRDLATDARWPSYAPRAAQQGARSMVSIPTMLEGKTMGALDVYSRQPDAFDAQAVSLVGIVAAHAGLASQVASTLFRHRDLSEGLRDAMASRAVIEQAKGMLMAQQTCSADAAFELLVNASQRENRKLRDVAHGLVDRYADSQVTGG